MFMENKPGKSTILIGMQYGDEGKGRVLDKLLFEDEEAVVVRFNGGANAGHTLEVGNKKIVLHQVPSGIFYPEMLLYIGSGCVINPKKLNEEIIDIQSAEISLDDRFFISSHAPLIQPHHLLYDEWFGGGIGTTKNGIGPCYADQALRAQEDAIRNIKLGEYLADPGKCFSAVKRNLEEFLELWPLERVDVIGKMEHFDAEVMKLQEYRSEDPLFLERLIQSGKNVFFEGAQSVLLDVVTGMTPYVTSSRTLAAAAYTGGDLSLNYHHKTIGVAKAIMSRVGRGPFISEFGGKQSDEYCARFGGKQSNENCSEREMKANAKEVEQKEWNLEELRHSDDPFLQGVYLRMKGNEYGATTGRPRRIGTLDLVQLRQICALNGVNELYLNKFDALTEFGEMNLPGIPVVVAYRLDGKVIDYVPTTLAEMERVKPITECLPNIPDVSSVRTEKELPSTAKEVVQFIEEFVGVPLHGLGVGPEREQYVELKKG